MLSGNRFFGFVATDTKIDTEQKKRAKKPAKIGFIMARMTCDEVEIITFCVLPEYRNMGVGKSLLEELHRHVKARGATLIFLEVAEDNAAAIKLYHNMGYKRIALRIKYYCSGGITRDAIVMRLCFEVV
jgi:ribosomal-protein-alanine N-acetyltransferase